MQMLQIGVSLMLEPSQHWNTSETGRLEQDRECHSAECESDALLHLQLPMDLVTCDACPINDASWPKAEVAERVGRFLPTMAGVKVHCLAHGCNPRRIRR
jgi:hypothetical protein